MMRLLFSPAAQNDIENIYDYTLQTWGADQAQSYIGQLRDACNGLQSGKLKGRDASDIRQGYLKRTCGSHLIFYRYRNSQILEVIRILHQRMDIGAHL